MDDPVPGHRPLDVGSSRLRHRGDPRGEGTCQAGLLDLDLITAPPGQQRRAAVRGSGIDADHPVDGATLAGDASQGSRQPLGAVPAEHQGRHVVGPDHPAVVLGGQEPVEGVVSAGVNIVDHPDLALTDLARTDHHEAPR